MINQKNTGMDKEEKIVKKGQNNDNLKYWLSLSKRERLEQLEEMRQQVTAQNYATEQRFQRVYSITKRA